MPTTIITPNQDAIIAEIQITAPPDRVFKAISDQKELALWFTSPECPVQRWKMDARPGGHYSYMTQKGAIVVNGVSEFECHGDIVEFDPPRVLAYTWFGNWHDDPKSRTLVRWELTPRQGGTHVKVTHSGLSSLPVARKDYVGGWPGVVEQLKRFVEQ